MKKPNGIGNAHGNVHWLLLLNAAVSVLNAIWTVTNMAWGVVEPIATHALCSGKLL